MAKIIVTHGLPAEGFDLLSGHEILIPPPLSAFTHAEMLTLITDADAVVAGGAMPADLIEAAQNLKIIANYGAGYDKVDVTAAARRGIPVTNIPEAVTDVTAELAVALMLSVARRVGEMNLRTRREDPSALFGMGRHMGTTLRGRTLGILGCGRIGSRVAEVAKSLGMRVIAHNRRGVDPAIATPVDFDTLLAASDVLTLHCPLTAETRNIIDRAAIARMKPGAILINTARGAVIDNEALAEAVATGHLSGAGLDVFPDEPTIPPCLIAQERIVLTPHVGSNTYEDRCEMARACSRQILDVLAGKRPVNIVNGLKNNDISI